jgi:hypothetical protein
VDMAKEPNLRKGFCVYLGRGRGSALNVDGNLSGKALRRFLKNSGRINVTRS